MSDIEERVMALRAHVAQIQEEVRECVRELLGDADAIWPVAESLIPLGSGAIPAIHEILADSETPPEPRIYAAVIGLIVGDRGLSKDVLLDEVRGRRDFETFAALRLADSRIAEAGPVILDVLRETDSASVDKVVSYLEALELLGVTLPEEEQRRLRASRAWQVAMSMEQLYPVS